MSNYFECSKNGLIALSLCNKLREQKRLGCRTCVEHKKVTDVLPAEEVIGVAQRAVDEVPANSKNNRSIAIHLSRLTGMRV